MCGIAGILRLDGEELSPEAPDVVRTMTDAMKWRGPDGEGLWKNGPVCLGHRRLSIIDLAGGAQPMRGPGGLCIVFNGEIYNFKEIRTELEQKGAVFQNESDTEAILQAYAIWGESCVDRLEGMFAFALWDPHFRKLFCARDHFGKKPFYYTLQNGYFAFASELRPLSMLKSVCRFANFRFTLSPSALTRYLAYEYTPVPQTMYAEAHSLDPAHVLTVENGRLTSRRFWELPWPDEKLPATEDEVCQELYSRMKRATSLRMISDVPLGVFLSGGIDSTIVAGLMAELSPAPIQAFSIGFNEASYDESSYAAIAASAYDAIHHTRILSADECAKQLPGIAAAMDTPMADASCAPTWLLAGLAREKVTVCLGGDGADEFWAGYEHYIGYKIARWYNRLPGFIRSIVEKVAACLPESAGYINPRLVVATFLKGAASPDWLRVQTMLTAFDPACQKKILSRDWLSCQKTDLLEQEEVFAPTMRQYGQWQPMAVAGPLERAFNVYIRQFMLDDILVKVDRCSMLHSLEVRSPFLDKQVTEFVAKLPVSCKLHGFKRKYLLKKAFARLLPPAILKRNKRGFQIPVAEWLRSSLKPLLLENLSPERLGRQGIFDSAEIRQLMEAHFSGRADLRKQLWTLLVLQLWLDGARPDMA